MGFWDVVFNKKRGSGCYGYFFFSCGVCCWCVVYWFVIVVGGCFICEFVGNIVSFVFDDILFVDDVWVYFLGVEIGKSSVVDFVYFRGKG